MIIKALLKYIPLAFSLILLMELFLPSWSSNEQIQEKTGYKSISIGNTMRTSSHSNTKMIYGIITNESSFRISKEVFDNLTTNEVITIERTFLFGQIKKISSEKIIWEGGSVFSQFYYAFPILQLALSFLTILYVKKKNKWRTSLILPNFFLTIFIVLSILFSNTI
ncbi:MAG: hypothetical protein HYU68_14685 [Bacteroidetes bacterium]|nr:hypothetical protein [Bacteroidota bacterium]